MNDNVITNDDNDDNDNDTIVSAGSNNNNNNHTKNNEQDDKTIIAKNNNENDDSKSSTKIASDATITTSSASNTTTATTNISTNIQSSSTNIKTEANLESWNNTSSSSSSQPQPPQSQSQYPFGQAAKGFNDRSLDPALFAADPSMKLAPNATTNTTAPATVPVTSAATSNNAPPTTSAPTPIATSNAPIGYYNQAPIFDGRNGASFILTTTTQPTPQDYPSTTYSGRFTNGIAVIPPPNFSISPNNNNKQSPSPSPRQVTSPQSMMTTFSSKTVSSTPKRYKCSVCQKRFTRPSSLQTHMYSHTGEKPFKCPVEGCGRHFSVVSNLRRHQKIHTNNNNNSSSSNMAPAIFF